MQEDCLKLLLHGIDTLQCAYYLLPIGKETSLNFDTLSRMREGIRQSKAINALPLTIGNSEFLLQPYGTSSGYPLVLKNKDFKIELGEFNWPNFFVTFTSEGLWRESAFGLHKKFLKWVESVGYKEHKNETLSRVDFTFDYSVPEIDFSEDDFVSRSTKDSQHRENKKTQTFQFGKGDIVLRVYNKVAEINQKSEKVWFLDLWGQSEGVWRIEWQARKELLKRFGIITFKDLEERHGDILRYLATEHDTLRVPNGDDNSSRWPLHPLWENLIEKILTLNHSGIERDYKDEEIINERLMRLGISVYGYMKRMAALNCMNIRRDTMTFKDALIRLDELMKMVHEPLTWNEDIKRKVKGMQLGEW
jgi:hypothetical protein